MDKCLELIFGPLCMFIWKAYYVIILCMEYVYFKARTN